MTGVANCAACIAAMLVLGSPLVSQVLVKDIDPGIQTGDWSSNPSDFLACLGQVYFFAAGKLWKSDGSASGTVVLDQAGPGGPRRLTTFGSGFLFSGFDAAHGQELWFSDGTRGGTKLVYDCAPGPDSSNFLRIEVAGTRAFFWRTTLWTNAAIELWSSDGTSAGTLRLATTSLRIIDPLTGTVLGANYLFRVPDPTGRSELWVSDGSPTGTTKLLDMGPVWYSLVGPNLGFRRFGQHVYFPAAAGVTGLELWRTDGTVAGTQLVVDIAQGPNHGSPGDLMVFGTKLFFSAQTDLNDRDVFCTDGTAAGTIRLLDTPPASKSYQPLWVTPHGELLFGAGGLATAGLWSTDGTPAGTRFLAPVYPVRSPLEDAPILAALGNFVCFPGSDMTFSGGVELWRSDGTPAGTRMVRRIGPPQSNSRTGMTGMAAVGRRVLFAAKEGDDNELWASDGTQHGTELLADLLEPQNASSVVAKFWSHDDRAYFDASDEKARKVWTSDGTTLGTRVAPSVAQSMRNRGVLLGNRWVYIKDSLLESADRELTQSTTVCYVPVRSTSLEPPGVPAGTRAFFVCASAAPGTGDCVIATNGTVEGTAVVAASNQRMARIGVLGARFLFASFDSTVSGWSAPKLWSSDGTLANTGVIHSSAGTSASPGLVVLGERGYLLWHDGARYDLWCTDATSAGTTKVTDPTFGELRYSGWPQATAAADRIWFVSVLPSSKWGLWASDGTKGGTVLVRAFDSLQDTTFVECNGALLFAAYDAPLGRELWRSDGTPAGTTLVRELDPGVGSGLPAAVEFARIGTGTRVVFGGFEPSTGIEPWITDGTSSGTRLLADLAPGTLGSKPSAFHRAGKNLFFSADDGMHGAELWLVTVPELRGSFVDVVGVGCRGVLGVPTLSALGNPTLGNAGFAIELTKAQPESALLWMLGIPRGHHELYGGCTLHMQLPVLRLQSSTDRSGAAHLGLAVPSRPDLVGLDIVVQAAILDPDGAWGGWSSFSSALRFLVGAK